MQDSRSKSHTLATPGACEQAHSAELVNQIRAQITDQGGFMPFVEYMNRVLYTPRLGYYASPAIKIGASGDFITAPELSPMFSWCVARQIATVLRELEQPIILELGAGSGAMALDILRELARLSALPTEYWILDVSGELRARQAERLAVLSGPAWPTIRWLNDWPTDSFEGVVVGNEVLDALPVQRFHWDADGLSEMGVAEKAGQLSLALAPASEALKVALADILPQLPVLPQGYQSEICLWLTPWLRGLNACFTKGLILFIDYGYVRSEYYHPQRCRGTLMCHYQHHAHDDVFFYPGLQDITAQVDFTAVAEAADALGLAVLGFTHQAAFLINTGLQDDYARAIETHSVEDLYAIAQAIKRLTLPQEMGERFKVIALGKNWDPGHDAREDAREDALIGFRHFDQRERL
jgi:SAM-dependent MidA family methyltransferase